MRFLTLPASLSGEGRIGGNSMTRSIVNAPCRVAVTVMLAATLLLVMTDMARAETVEESELRAAAGSGNTGEVARLIAEGTDPNVPDHNGRTALHHAAETAQARTLNALLEAGGNPDVQDRDGSTPLHLAALFPYFEPDSQSSIRVLLNYRADPDLADRDGRTPLHLVARMHLDAASVLDLLRSGADAGRADSRGDTPLHYAVDRHSKFSADVVAALVDGGAGGNTVGGGGETPLQIFARFGANDGRIVHALVDGGADPNAKNPDGETPLHTAIRNGGNLENPKVVEALLGSGADPCITDAAGYIPYNTAREGGTVHSMLANAGGSDFTCDDAPEIVEADLVRRIQAALAAKGYNPGPADGVMGGQTHAAIEAWQDAMGFPATGGLTAEEVDVLLAEAASLEPSSGSPGPLCSGTGKEDGCWLQIAERDSCYLWKHYPLPEESVTWSGDCSGGKASGMGTEVRTYRNWEDKWTTSSGEGPYVDGKPHGHWVVRYAGGTVGEGPYVDGERHGHWVLRWDGGGAEGPFVNGKEHGHWVYRSADGSCFNFEYSRGDLVSDSDC